MPSEDLDAWMFDDLLTMKVPPEKRARGVGGGEEHHLTEAAVMLAYAMHLLRTTTATKVSIHPDGMHGLGFDIRGWLLRQGFEHVESAGKTSYGGIYRHADGCEIEVYLRPGRGDVGATLADGSRVVAEAKGGIVNTTHAGQTSRVRRGLCEAVGLLMAEERRVGVRQVAVVPQTPVTESLARKMALRARQAGIEIALVDGQGNVKDAAPI